VGACETVAMSRTPPKVEDAGKSTNRGLGEWLSSVKDSQKHDAAKLNAMATSAASSSTAAAITTGSTSTVQAPRKRGLSTSSSTSSSSSSSSSKKEKKSKKSTLGLLGLSRAEVSAEFMKKIEQVEYPKSPFKAGHCFFQAADNAVQLHLPESSAFSSFSFLPNSRLAIGHIQSYAAFMDVSDPIDDSRPTTLGVGEHQVFFMLSKGSTGSMDFPTTVAMRRAPYFFNRAALTPTHANASTYFRERGDMHQCLGCRYDEVVPMFWENPYDVNGDKKESLFGYVEEKDFATLVLCSLRPLVVLTKTRAGAVSAFHVHQLERAKGAPADSLRSKTMHSLLIVARQLPIGFVTTIVPFVLPASWMTNGDRPESDGACCACGAGKKAYRGMPHSCPEKWRPTFDR